MKTSHFKPDSKTETPTASRHGTRSRGQFWIGAAGVLLAGLLAGCLPSLHPIYTEKDVIFDNALLGTWKGEPHASDAWTFERVEQTNTYRLVVTEEAQSSPFTARLVKLRDQRFLDLMPHKDGLETLQCEVLYRSGLVRAHLFLRVDEIGSVLKMQLLDMDWLEALLEKEPGAIAHYRDEDEIFVLTAATKELQAFLIKHLDTENAWKPIDVLNRVGKP